MNMMSDEPYTPIKPIVINSESIPKKPRVMLWHWVQYYAYNLWRKPKVWRAKRALMDLSNFIHLALERTVYPELLKKLPKCQMCADAYAALRPQIFLSQIELILKRMKCSSHHAVFEVFCQLYESEFRRSEELAAFINGFGKEPKKK